MTWAMYHHSPPDFRPEWRLPEMKDGDWIGYTAWLPGKTALLPHTYYREGELWATRWEIDWSDRRSVEQTRSIEARPIISGSRALSRKLMFCDKLIAKNNILRLPNSQPAGARYPFPPSNSLLLFPPPDKEEERDCNPSGQGTWKKEGLWKMGKFQL